MHQPLHIKGEFDLQRTKAPLINGALFLFNVFGIIISKLFGCIKDCRVIGAITANQTEKRKTIRNDRFISIPEASQMFVSVKEIKDLPRDIIDQLENFFINYNELEGKKFKPLKRLNAQQAFKLIKPK